MDSPGYDSTTNRVAVRSSVIDSIRACTLDGAQIPKEELKMRISMPQYLRFAIRDAIQSKNVDAGRSHYDSAGDDPVKPPDSPLVVFINSKSGGRHGPQLKGRLQELMTEEQVPLISPHYIYKILLNS